MIFDNHPKSMALQVSRRKVESGKSFTRIGLLAKSESEASLHCLKKLLPALKKYAEARPGISLFIDKDLASHFRSASYLKPAEAKSMAKTCELLLSVGGDGTLLRAARLLLESDGWKAAALLGINTGRLGFLTILGSEDAPSGLESLLNHPEKSHLEPRGCLEIQVIRKGRTVESAHVLNDCVLKNGALSRLIEFRISMNKDFLSSYRADGLILSTPTGSTAYNLAAGGAILEPQIPAVQLAPICAQSFSNKPIVVSDENTITVTIGQCSSDVFLTLDGHTVVKIESDDRIQVKKSTKSIALLLPQGIGPAHYFQSLRQKLKWGLVSPTPT